MTPLQRILLVALGILALAALGLAGWLVWSNIRSTPLALPTQPAPAEPLPAVPSPQPTATTLPTPVERTAEPPTPTTPLLAPTTDSSPTACLPTFGMRTQAQVVEVLAANRIRVDLDGQKQEVLYLGVELAGVPEPALAANQILVEGQTVTLVADSYDNDPQGTLLRYVLVGETLVNYTLIRDGMAITALTPPGIACDATFLAAERAAQADKVGFWALPVPNYDPATRVTAAAPPCPCDTSFTCADFTRQEAAQACYNACGDYRNAALDTNHDGIACEQLP